MGFGPKIILLIFLIFLCNQAEENCIYMRSDGTWNDASCSESHDFVCASVSEGNIFTAIIKTQRKGR